MKIQKGWTPEMDRVKWPFDHPDKITIIRRPGWNTTKNGTTCVGCGAPRNLSYASCPQCERENPE